MTANVVEYYGCISALRSAIRSNIHRLIFIGDSKLVINQLCGLFNCRLPHLQTLLTQAHELAKQLRYIEFHHEPELVLKRWLHRLHLPLHLLQRAYEAHR